MNENIKKFYDTLSDDVKGKLKACKSQEEMLKVLDDADIALDPELLKSVSGGDMIWHGCTIDSYTCPSQGCDPANSVC